MFEISVTSSVTHTYPSFSICILSIGFSLSSLANTRAIFQMVSLLSVSNSAIRLSLLLHFLPCIFNLKPEILSNSLKIICALCVCFLSQNGTCFYPSPLKLLKNPLSPYKHLLSESDPLQNLVDMEH